MLAYLAENSMTHTSNQCSLWFLLVHTCLLAYLLTWIKISGLAPKISVVCVFLIFITCLLAQKCQDTRKIWLWFVFSTWSYLLTWPKISGHARRLPVVCGFYLFILAYLHAYLLTCLLAYLAPNFSTWTQYQCGLWFSTFPYLFTCPRNPKFQHSCEKSV